MKIRFSKYDKLWSKLVRERDKQCLYCGRKGILNAHHILGRRIKATRLCLENGTSLCINHHVWDSKFSAHKTPEKFRTWFKKTFSLRWEIINKKQRQHMSERQAVAEFEKLYG